MESMLQGLNGHLRGVQLLLNGPFQDELQRRLHDHAEGVLPDAKLATLANEAIDLLHSVEQMLEPGHLVLADHFLGGYMSTKCLCSAVQLRLPDILRDNGPQTVETLAAASNARPDRLRQVLNILHNNGIFSYDAETDRYDNNHTSTLLLRDHWTQWHNWVDLYGNQFYDMAAGIPASLDKDAVRCPAQIAFNTDESMFTHFRKMGWTQQLHRTLGGGATAQAPGILTDYSWAEVADETVLDIGGGGGALIALLLRAYPTMRGGIYDLPHVIEHTAPFFHDADGQFADLAERVPRENLVGGDFFVSVPPSTVYTMKWTLHDWKDPDAIAILRNIRRAIVPGPRSRLVVLESILAQGRSARLSRYGDLNMMVAANGLERTERDWHRLAGQSGWRIARILPLRNAWPCAIEMRPDIPRSNGVHNL
ncbi:S-adenosyl-L-methionine-dependent methyltransferase [Aspergillus floccosus]